MNLTLLFCSVQYAAGRTDYRDVSKYGVRFIIPRRLNEPDLVVLFNTRPGAPTTATWGATHWRHNAGALPSHLNRQLMPS